jgi:tRNA pseudouridine38-40 synthase
LQRRIKAVVQYDGTDYSGFQRQTNARSVQEVLETGLSKLLGHPVVVRASGRTDSGVHARGQVVAFDTCASIPAERVPRAVAGFLPRDIIISAACEVPLIFDPLRDAVSKTYCYRLWRHTVPDLFWSRFTYWYPGSLDFDVIQAETLELVGRHDFRNFRAQGSSATTTVREVFDVEWKRKDKLWEFYITANGFLYKMVRLLVGTLLDIGRGRYGPGTMRLALNEIPRVVGTCAPPQGLSLEEVQFS